MFVRINLIKKSVLIISILILSVGFAMANPADSSIAFWVHDALKFDRRINASDINTSVKMGIVTLTGKVHSILEKQLADEETRKISGVLGLIDELQIETPARYDSDIRHDIQRRIVDNSNYWDFKNVKVDVSNAAVTLSGDVDSWEQRRELKYIVFSVAGVKKINNDIKVNYVASEKPTEILADVLSAIDRDVYLNGLAIEVEVHPDTVILDGTVGNAFQKLRAQEDAQMVNSVNKVRNKIAINWMDNLGVRKQSPKPDNKTILNALNETYKMDDRIDGQNIAIKFNNGNVVLVGSVPTFLQKQAAEQDASEVIGVTMVTNLLVVDSPRRQDDSILRDVNFRLNSNLPLATSPINASVKEGVVNLDGTVNDYYEKMLALDDIAAVDGVLDIKDNIVVKYPDFADDQTIKNNIKQRIKSSAITSFDADNIHVSVKGREVTLTGVVSIWDEWHEARRLAMMTEGVQKVDNRLVIRDVNFPWDNSVN